MREKQLTAYKKLLEGQIDVIDSRLKMVERIDNNGTGSKKTRYDSTLSQSFALFS